MSSAPLNHPDPIINTSRHHVGVRMGFWSEPFARILAECVLERLTTPHVGSCGSREMKE